MWTPALALAAALGAASPDTVDTAAFPRVGVGRPVSGELRPHDAAMSRRGRFRVYRFEARAGQRYVISMESSDFDSYLGLAQVVGGITELIRSDDDGGDALNSRLQWTAGASGAYLLIAQSYEPEGLGSFELRVDPAARPTTGAWRSIQPGAEQSGTLADTDSVLPEDDTYFDAFTLRARQGQRLTIEMRADSFDAFLHLGQVRVGGWEPLATDDDGLGEGLNSRIRFTVPEDGIYVIRANSLSPATGSYRLRVHDGASGPTPSPGPAPRALRAGETAEGTLDESDPLLSDGSYFDTFAYEGRAGEELTVTLSSDDFDTFLQFGRMVGGRFEEISSNDDAEDGTNSRVVVRVPAAGRYLVRANSFRAGETGRYRLHVAGRRHH